MLVRWTKKLTGTPLCVFARVCCSYESRPQVPGEGMCPKKTEDASLLMYDGSRPKALYLMFTNFPGKLQGTMHPSVHCCLEHLEHSPVRYVLIIQSNVESGPKMIQFNIQFKMNSEIFIQSKNSFKSWSKVFNSIFNSRIWWTIIQMPSGP